LNDSRAKTFLTVAQKGAVFSAEKLPIRAARMILSTGSLTGASLSLMAVMSRPIRTVT